MSQHQSNTMTMDLIYCLKKLKRWSAIDCEARAARNIMIMSYLLHRWLPDVSLHDPHSYIINHPHLHAVNVFFKLASLS